MPSIPVRRTCYIFALDTAASNQQTREERIREAVGNILAQFVESGLRGHLLWSLSLFLSAEGVQKSGDGRKDFPSVKSQARGRSRHILHKYIGLLVFGQKQTKPASWK